MREDTVEKTKGKVIEELRRGAAELKGKIRETSGKAVEVLNEKSEAASGGQDNPPAV